MNSKKLLIIPALFIALSIMAQEANLTMKPVVKSKYNVEVSMQMNITQNMPGMEIKINALSDAKAIMEIEDVAQNGDFTVLSTWKEIKTKSSAMGKDTTMNFDNLNLKMKTVYNKNGKVIRNERVDSVSNPAIAMIEQLATGMRLPILAGETVKKNEKWISHTNDTIQPMGAPFNMIVNAKDEYTFTGKESKEGKEYYRINVSGPTKISGQGSQMGMDMTVDGNGMNEGYSLLDTSTLFPSLIESNMGLDVNIIVAGAQSMAIPMTQNVVTTIKFSKIK